MAGTWPLWEALLRLQHCSSRTRSRTGLAYSTQAKAPESGRGSTKAHTCEMIDSWSPPPIGCYPLNCHVMPVCRVSQANWAKGQPATTSGVEWCSAIQFLNGAWRWVVQPCDTTNAILCELPESEQTATPSSTHAHTYAHG